ncbi:hypothetical protein ACMSIO_05395 [Pseudomonas benzopyrenica]|uniref:hypothetical protein n=1 Tax=Pseudomonas benzopyrenica TaxID=2993566 RepID=UPI0039C2930C
MSKSDPVNIKYYVPLENASRLSDVAFFLSAVLSIVCLYVDKAGFPILYAVVNVSFVLAVAAVFVSGLAVKLYYFPRAEDERIKDFLGHAYQMDVISDQSEAYYNNNARTASERMGAQLLENSLFSKEIASKMLRGMSVRYAIYFLAWLAIALTRNVDYGIILVASQVIFAEQVFAKFIRLIWLKARFEKTYDQTYRLFFNGVTGKRFHCAVVENLVFYETSKTSASIQLSSRVFNKVNPKLTADWDSIRQKLKIDL